MQSENYGAPYTLEDSGTFNLADSVPSPQW